MSQVAIDLLIGIICVLLTAITAFVYQGLEEVKKVSKKIDDVILHFEVKTEKHDLKITVIEQRINHLETFCHNLEKARQASTVHG